MPSHAATKTVYLLSSAVLDSVELPGLAALAHNDGFTYELGVCVCVSYTSLIHLRSLAPGWSFSTLANDRRAACHAEPQLNEPCQLVSRISTQAPSTWRVD